MPDTLIENPILNSPYREPTRHFRFGDAGITNEIVETRRARRGQGSQDGHGPNPVGSGRDQSWRLRALGFRGSHRSV